MKTAAAAQEPLASLLGVYHCFYRTALKVMTPLASWIVAGTTEGKEKIATVPVTYHYHYQIAVASGPLEVVACCPLTLT